MAFHLRLKEVENIRTTRSASRWLSIAVACVQFTRWWRSDEAILSRARDPVRHWIPPGTRRLILYLAPRLATGVATPTLPRTPSQPSLFAFPPVSFAPLHHQYGDSKRSPRFFAPFDTFHLSCTHVALADALIYHYQRGKNRLRWTCERYRSIEGWPKWCRIERIELYVAPFRCWTNRDTHQLWYCTKFYFISIIVFFNFFFFFFFFLSLKRNVYGKKKRHCF